MHAENIFKQQGNERVNTCKTCNELRLKIVFGIADSLLLSRMRFFRCRRVERESESADRSFEFKSRCVRHSLCQKISSGRELRERLASSSLGWSAVRRAMMAPSP
jgi:hypothetical protein